MGRLSPPGTSPPHRNRDVTDTLPARPPQYGVRKHRAEPMRGLVDMAPWGERSPTITSSRGQAVSALEAQVRLGGGWGGGGITRTSGLNSKDLGFGGGYWDPLNGESTTLPLPPHAQVHTLT